MGEARARTSQALLHIAFPKVWLSSHVYSRERMPVGLSVDLDWNGFMAARGGISDARRFLTSPQARLLTPAVYLVPSGKGQFAPSPLPLCAPLVLGVRSYLEKYINSGSSLLQPRSVRSVPQNRRHYPNPRLATSATSVASEGSELRFLTALQYVPCPPSLILAQLLTPSTHNKQTPLRKSTSVLPREGSCASLRPSSL